MVDRHKLVVRFNQWYNPVMEERFQREPDLELKTVDRDGPDEGVWPDLGRAHAFQVSSAKDELPRRWFVTPELLSRCPQLLVVSSNGAGYDTVDVPACTEAGVLVVNQAGGNAQSVAEHTIGLMLDVTRRISENDRLLRTERGFSREDIMGYEMSGKTVGIVGIGHIGTRRCEVGAGLRHDGPGHRSLPDGRGDRTTRRPAVTRDQLLERSDFVTLHCPRNKDTMNMMDADAFARMKKGAIFVSTARGGIHNEEALLKALQSGHLRRSGTRRMGQGTAAARPSAAPDSGTWLPLSIPLGSPMKRGETWRSSLRSRLSESSKGDGLRDSSIPKHGQPTPPASKRYSDLPCRR